MENIFTFIAENYGLIILIAACLLDLILFLVGVFKKKKFLPFDDLLSRVPVVVRVVEEQYGSGNGELKKKTALEILKNMYKKSSGVEISDDCQIMKFLSAFIEEILKTPTKKGK